MMKTLKISEVRQKIPALLKLIEKARESIMITRYGKPVAGIIPFPKILMSRCLICGKHNANEPLSPQDAIDSTLLPGEFHRDPADRMIVTMVRRYGAALVTSDEKIRSYEHVS